MSNYSIIIVVVFLPLWVGIIFSRFASMDGKMNKLWKDSQNLLKQRYQLFPLIVNMAKNQATYDQENLQILMNIYTQANDQRTNQNTHLDLDSQATPLLSSLLIHFQNYPSLSRNPEFINLERNVLNIENQLNNYKNSYNGLVQEYNQLLSTNPNKIIAFVFRFSAKQFLQITTLNR